MFGFGVGKIEVSIPKKNYSPGEEIKGNLLLTLKKPARARGVFIKIFAEQRFREVQSQGGKQSTSDVMRVVYTFQEALDSEREYEVTSTPVSYPFTLLVPGSANSATAEPSLPFGNLQISMGGFSLGPGAGPIGPAQWYLEGFLDVPLAVDVKAKLALNI